MKKITTLLAAVLLATSLFGAGALDDFMAKANAADKSIKIKQAAYDRARIKYEAVSRKIDSIKNEKTSGFFIPFINTLKLNYLLKAGNKLGYESYTLNRELTALKDDYFTFSMLVIDEYTKKVKDCAAAGCPELKAIFDAREGWVKATGAFESFYKLEAAPEMLADNMTQEAKKDLIEFMKRKLVQLDERIYMMKEEKQILNLVKNSGINIPDNMTLDVDREIKELVLKNRKLSESIKRIENN